MYETEVFTCGTCNGTGRIYFKPYQRRPGEGSHDTCGICCGRGIVTVEYR